MADDDSASLAVSSLMKPYSTKSEPFLQGHLVQLPRGCLNHYVPTTGDHHDRPAGGAISGAPEPQNQAQRGTAPRHRPCPKIERGEVDTTSRCETSRDAAQAFSG